MAVLALEARPIDRPSGAFGIEAAGRLLNELPSWVQELSLLVEGIESSRPPGAPADWQPGALVRLPFAPRLCRDGIIGAQALMAVADAAMTLACAAAWNGYRPMCVVDQTTHFLRPANFDVMAEARLLRIGRTNSFGRVTLSSAIDRRPVAMVSSAYATL